METYEMDAIIGLIKALGGSGSGSGSGSTDITPLTNRIAIVEKRIGNLQFTLTDEGLLHIEEVEY